MDRRGFLALSGAGLLAVSARAAGAGPSQACYKAGSGAVRCATGFVQTPEIEQDNCRALGWAVCLAYMLRGYGADITLASVLAHSRFSRQCGARGPASDGLHHEERLLLASSGVWRDRRNRSFLVSATALPPLSLRTPKGDALRQVTDRLARQPVLCGAAGHTTLMTEIKTLNAPLSAPSIEQITLRDPWAAQAPLRTLAPAADETPFFVIALSVRAQMRA